MSNLIDGLNAEQRSAVCYAGDGGVMVFAGAGTGKTRVLTRRILWLLENEQCLPGDILAVTFSDRASTEMTERLNSGGGGVGDKITVGTFHSVCNRINGKYLELIEHYNQENPIDGEEQKSWVTSLSRELGKIIKSPEEIDKCAGAINSFKREGKRAAKIMQGALSENLSENMDPDGHYAMAKLYEAYEKRCHDRNRIDFGEMLLACVELFKKHDGIRKQYAGKYKYILIDEMQDTDRQQFEWLNLLDSGENKYFAVGDDDQCIYSFRGAERGNIERIENELRANETVLLEENYRSSGAIVDAGNHLILNNKERRDKKLFTKADKGAPVSLRKFQCGEDEAKFLGEKVLELLREGSDCKDIAVLCKLKRQRYAIEPALISRNIKYAFVGKGDDSTMFLERVESKRVLWFLKLAVGECNDALKSVFLEFADRIGKGTWEKIELGAAKEGLSIENFVFGIEKYKSLPVSVSILKLREFYKSERSFGELVEFVINEFHILKGYKPADCEKRMDNLKTLACIANEYIGDGGDKLQAFISYANNALLDDDDNVVNSIKMMTIHKSKGLEFDHVFIPGIIEGIFPDKRRLENVDEERRVLYVGITRARKTLWLSSACSYGDRWTNPSIFLSELGIKKSKLERR